METIRRIVKRSVPDVTFIGLFGSRLDDRRRGGDVDLYLERPGGLSLEAQARLLVELEEALQLPVDLVARDPGVPPRPIEEIARSMAVPL